MSKKLLSALVLIGVTVIILILQRGSLGLDLRITEISMAKSLGLLLFTGIGVAIGILLK
jgi:hypothetical protein